MVVPIPLKLSRAYLVLARHPVLIDTGSPGEGGKIRRILEDHQPVPTDLSLIVLTHAHTDHAGNAAQLKRLSRAPLALHPGDEAMIRRGTMGPFHPLRSRHRVLEWNVNRPFEPVASDISLYKGQRLDEFGLAALVMSTPGHTSGSVSVVLDDGDAIAGDLLIGGFLGGMVAPNRPRLPYFVEDLSRLRQSIGELIATVTGRIYLGHGGPLESARVRSWFHGEALPTEPRTDG